MILPSSDPGQLSETIEPKLLEAVRAQLVMTPNPEYPTGATRSVA